MTNTNDQGNSSEPHNEYATLRLVVDEIAADVGLSGVIRIDIDAAPAVQHAYGLAHRGLNVPNTVDTQFATASGTKSFTALTIMSLVEHGALRLDTTARSLLGKDLPLIDDRVTIEQLLSHRSGIGDYRDEDFDNDYNDYLMPVSVHELTTTEQFLAVLGGHANKFEPGTKFSYSNGGYVVLALIAERATGMSFHDLVDQRVLQPAGMIDSAFLRSDELPGRAAIGYLDDDGLRSNVFHLPIRGNGDGGMYTTAADVVRFWDALFIGRIVSPATVAEMVRTRSEAPDLGMTYGLGFWLDDANHSVFMHGFDAGVGFVSTYRSEQRTTTSVLCNQSRGAWPTSQRISALLLDQTQPPTG